MDYRGQPLLGKPFLDHAAQKTGARPTYLPHGATYPSAGVKTDLSSQVVTRASLSVAAGDNSASTNSFWGYIVIGVVAIAGVLAITQA